MKLRNLVGKKLLEHRLRYTQSQIHQLARLRPDFRDPDRWQALVVEEERLLKSMGLQAGGQRVLSAAS